MPCTVCHTGDATRPCPRCNCVLYCGRRCAKAHRRDHKRDCARLANERARLAKERALEQHARSMFDRGVACLEDMSGSRRDTVERAIECFQAALQVRTHEADPINWAATQSNLGMAYSSRISGERRDNVERAIGCFDAALQVYTREANPTEWATTQSNLGMAYGERISGERRGNMERAIKCFEAALQVYTRDANPTEWATTQSNLGVAYANCISGERRDNLERAIKHYDTALEIHTRDANPINWAATQSNLGAAYAKRISGERRANLERAIGYYVAALQVRTREADPINWAETQSNLGVAYANRISGERRDNLELAIKCYVAALEVRTREADQINWAKTQSNLGGVYLNRISGKRRDNVERAIECFEAALQVHTREADPAAWATTQQNCGVAHTDRMIGERRDNVERAIGCYEAALQVRTREAYPADHVATAASLARCFANTGQAERALECATEALAAADDRRGVVRSGQHELRRLGEDCATLFADAVWSCVQLHDDDSTSASALYVERAVELVDRCKAGALRDAMHWNALEPRDCPEPLLRRLRELRDAVREEQRLLDAGVAEASWPRWRERVAELHAFEEGELSEVDPGFAAAAQQSTPLDFAAVAAVAGDGAVTVHWFVDLARATVTAFTVWGGAVQLVVTVVDGETQLDELRSTITAVGAEDATNADVIRALERMSALLKPDEWLAGVPPELDQLVVVPHLFLRRVPFASLVLPDATLQPLEELVMDRFLGGVRVLPSAQVLPLLSSPSSSSSVSPAVCTDRYFAVANPTGGGDPLLFAEDEVAAVRDTIGAAHSRMLQGDDATRVAVLGGDALADADVAHFACHAAFDAADPEESGLHMVGGEMLTLHDVMGLRLRRAPLVLLSACESGVTSATASSDEYVSLPAAFVYAGARSVVGTLWTVDDEGSRFLLTRTCELMQEGSSAAAALVAATRELRSVEYWEWDGLTRRRPAFVDAGAAAGAAGAGGVDGDGGSGARYRFLPRPTGDEHGATWARDWAPFVVVG